MSGVTAGTAETAQVAPFSNTSPVLNYTDAERRALMEVNALMTGLQSSFPGRPVDTAQWAARIKFAAGSVVSQRGLTRSLDEDPIALEFQTVTGMASALVDAPSKKGITELHEQVAQMNRDANVPLSDTIPASEQGVPEVHTPERQPVPEMSPSAPVMPDAPEGLTSSE